MSLVALILVALIAAEPLLHSHPLQHFGGADRSSTCTICATAIGGLPVIHLSIGASQTVVDILDSSSAEIRLTNLPLTLPSRAPPAA